MAWYLQNEQIVAVQGWTNLCCAFKDLFDIVLEIVRNSQKWRRYRSPLWTFRSVHFFVNETVPERAHFAAPPFPTESKSGLAGPYFPIVFWAVPPKRNPGISTVPGFLFAALAWKPLVLPGVNKMPWQIKPPWYNRGGLATASRKTKNKSALMILTDTWIWK